MLPTRVSHLAEILAARTKLAVEIVEKRSELRAGTVYLVPPNHHVVITDHVVEAHEAGGNRPSPSIDRLLATAAEMFGERLIAVILSGMGSDGVVGAGEVKSRGGTVIIQNPETAAQPSMPRALPPTLVDFVANADRMAELLNELVTQAAAAPPEDEDRILTQFLDRVRERTGIDFSAYKRPTVLRRLQRRMVATASPTLLDYVRYVQKNPDEYPRLSSTFLIKVTEFFRDADLFDFLRHQLLPTLVTSARSRGRELRIWSAGCATGEEAYSLAILVAEALGPEILSFTVRIFATDLDSEAIAYARRGIYPATAVSGVPPELLDRYFIHEGDHYEVSKETRSLVVFGEHDLGQRAPFPRIDVIFCRNVLIYFTPELQKRALQLFAFSLREGGYLVLGKAESTTPYAEHFILDQPRLKIYRRAGDRVLIPPARIRESAPTAIARARARREPLWATTQNVRATRDAMRHGPERPDDLLLKLPVGLIVIDQDYDISFVNAMARRLLGIHGPAVGHDFVHLAHQLPSEELREAVAAAMDGETRMLTRPPAVEGDGDTTHIQLTLQPYRNDGSQGFGAIIITAIDVSDAVRERTDLQLEVSRNHEDRATMEDRLERLARNNRELLRANEEMTNSNAMLRGSNEELLVANEEVQAATEEVETLNEELQATNEELETLNEELQATVEELNTTNDDLEARSGQLAEVAASLAEQRQRSEEERQRLALILDGMTEGVLVVDREGRQVSANRAYVEAFGQGTEVTPEDATGHPLPREEWPQTRAGRGEVFSTSFTALDRASGERRWYEATGRGNGDSGGVVVIRDITDRSLRNLQERFIDTASHELRTPIAAMNNYLQLVERGSQERLDETSRGYLRGALEQARHLTALSDRLFDVSLIRHARLVAQHEPVDLRALLGEAIAEARAVAGDARIQEERNGRGKVTVHGDRLRLRQLFGNLLVNALTHGSSNQPIEVTLDVSGDTATVRIADRGPGIPRAVRAQLFTPFTTAAANGPEGLGLGLYLARAIAVSHGGSLVVEARSGGGTEAIVHLPLAKSTRRTSPTTPSGNGTKPAPARSRRRMVGGSADARADGRTAE
jgi:two-component system CheB/CheR fusion protein